METQEDNCGLRISIDYPRKDPKLSAKVKITAAGNNPEELEKNLSYMKGVAAREGGF